MKRTEADLEKDNRKRIAENVRYLFDKKGKTQNNFVKYCREKYGYSITQGNLSKRLNGEVNFGLMLLAYVCEYLDISMEKVCFENLNPAGAILEETHVKNKMWETFKVDKEDLDKYYGDYYCYFFPTIKEEKGIIEGTLKLNKSELEPYGRVAMSLKIPSGQGEEKKQLTKQYEGILLLSSKLSVLYCMVTNTELGECNFLTFRFNRGLNFVKNQGGLATVCTVSAGKWKVPVVHRMLICRKKPNKETLERLIPSLYLNRSDIIIEKKKLMDVMNECQLDESARKWIINNIEEKDFCIISEAILRGIKKKGEIGCTEWELISKVRGKAYNAKYNKISPKADEQVIELLSSSIFERK